MSPIQRIRALTLALILSLVTIPSALAAGSVTFSASGDYGQTTNTTKVLQAVAASESAYHLALGDLSYKLTGSEPAWCSFVTGTLGTTYPFELIAGNHDSGLGVGSGKYEAFIDRYAQCLPNRLPGLSGVYGRKYYVDQPAASPNVRIIMVTPGIDFRDPVTAKATTSLYTPTTAEYTWVANAIDDARAQGIPWVVVGLHYPCLTVGAYDCSAGWSMGKDLMALLIAKKVDLVVGGHEHIYQRTYQLGYGPGCPTAAELRPQKSKTDVAAFDPDCIRSKSADTVKGAGTTFATIGTGGVPLRDINLSDPERGYFATYSGLNVKPSWGSLFLTATPTKLSATFRPVVGTFTDAFSITDSAVPVPPDADADGTPDASDLCRLLAGPAARRGCPTTFLGSPSADTITGTPFADIIGGRAGNDTLRGLGGNDRITGGLGKDTLVGDAGADTLIGGPQADVIRAGTGDDSISVRDKTRDTVYCGLGRDTVIADRIDVLRGCERVTRR